MHSTPRRPTATNAPNRRLYWGIGWLLDERQARECWGAAVIARLARDLRDDLPEVRGFSARNLGRMLALARAHPEPGEVSPLAVAKTLGDPPSIGSRSRSLLAPSVGEKAD